MIESLIVLAKEPRPGHAKTRLSPPLTPHQASDVAAAALRDTLRGAARVTAQRRLLFFDGDVTAWLPTGWAAAAQPAGGLDVRLASAFGTVAAAPAVLIGMDTPHFDPGELAAFDPDRYDACLGRASDGGYWAIGFADPGVASAAIVGVPMSTDHTGDDQLRRLHALGLRVQALHELTDVDTIEDARVVAGLSPGSDFAVTLAAATAGAADGPARV